ncbi:MAG: MvdC/MvdD family ATP grasp protein, partial [Myxococcota bacterium]
MILVLSSPTDLHADAVEPKIRAAGAEVVRFDRAEYPAHASLAFGVDPSGRPSRILRRTSGPDIDLDDVTAIWHRRPGMPTPHADLAAPWMGRFVVEEGGPLFRDLWDSFDGLQVPGPRSVYRRAEHKYTNLVLAAELGFEVPDTLVTNDPAALLAFYRRHDGRIVSKMANQILNNKFAAPRYNRFTEVVTPRDIAYFRSARHDATIFQGYVPKRVELRVTVVGSALFAAEIRSQETNHTRHDWRRYDHSSTPIVPHELPPAVADRCRRLVARLGLVYGAIDLVLTPDDRYVFLEINPNGQFLWVEQLTGFPIAAAIADLLVAADRASHAARAQADQTSMQGGIAVPQLRAI